MQIHLQDAMITSGIVRCDQVESGSQAGLWPRLSCDSHLCILQMAVSGIAGLVHEASVACFLF